MAGNIVSLSTLVFNVMLKFKMAPTDQPHHFCGPKNLKSEITQILQSHSPRYGDVQVVFLRFY